MEEELCEILSVVNEIETSGADKECTMYVLSFCINMENPVINLFSIIDKLYYDIDIIKMVLLLAYNKLYARDIIMSNAIKNCFSQEEMVQILLDIYQICSYYLNSSTMSLAIKEVINFIEPNKISISNYQFIYQYYFTDLHEHLSDFDANLTNDLIEQLISSNPYLIVIHDSIQTYWLDNIPSKKVILEYHLSYFPTSLILSNLNLILDNSQPTEEDNDHCVMNFLFSNEDIVQAIDIDLLKQITEYLVTEWSYDASVTLQILLQSCDYEIKKELIMKIIENVEPDDHLLHLLVLQSINISIHEQNFIFINNNEILLSYILNYDSSESKVTSPEGNEMSMALEEDLIRTVKEKIMVE